MIKKVKSENKKPMPMWKKVVSKGSIKPEAKPILIQLVNFLLLRIILFS